MSACVRQSEYIVFLGLYLSRLSSVRANFLYEAKSNRCKHTPKKPADFDDFRLKAVGQPAQPPTGQVDGRRLIFPTDYE